MKKGIKSISIRGNKTKLRLFIFTSRLSLSKSIAINISQRLFCDDCVFANSACVSTFVLTLSGFCPSPSTGSNNMNKWVLIRHRLHYETHPNGQKCVTHTYTTRRVMCKGRKHLPLQIVPADEMSSINKKKNEIANGPK